MKRPEGEEARLEKSNRAEDAAQGQLLDQHALGPRLHPQHYKNKEG